MKTHYLAVAALAAVSTATTQNTNNPQLTMTISGPNVILQWPTNFTGFQVHYTTNNLLSGTSWSAPLPLPPIISNGQFIITIPDGVSTSNRFYRLVK